MNKHLQNSMERLKKGSLLIFSLLAFLFVLPNKANATHVMGADITYRCISNLKFEVTVKYYRSCQGVSFQ